MSRRYEVGCGAVLVLGLATTAFLLLQVGALDGWGDQVEARVELPDAAGLNAGSSVALAGVEIGRVDRMELVGDRAVATLLLDPGAQVRKDATVKVRARSVLGEKYLAVVPGSPTAPLLVDGDALSAGPPQVEIDQLVTALGPLVEAVDPEVIARVLHSVDDLLADDPEVLARILANADATLEDAAAAAKEGRLAVQEGRQTLARANRTLGVFEDRGREVAALVVRADALLVTLQDASGPLPETAARADRVLADLERAIALQDAGVDLAAILRTFGDLDEDTIRRLLRDDGVRVHLFGRRKRNRTEE